MKQTEKKGLVVENINFNYIVNISLDKEAKIK